MPAALDHVADANGVELARLSRLYEFPDFVKSASLERVMNPGRIANAAYADQRRRQFPCHNAASTWLSYVYFTEKRAELSAREATHIQSRLDHYVRYWRIKTAVDRYLSKHAEYTREATATLPDSDYAYVWADDRGNKERRLPLRNANEVKVAADWLATYHDRLPFPDANAIASKILQKAVKYGAAIQGNIELLEKKAGRGVCNPAEVVQTIKDRVLLAKNAEDRRQIGLLLDVIEKTPRKALLPDMLVKLATTLDMVDRTLGLHTHYGKGLKRPEDVLFSVTFTKAAAETSGMVSTTSGKVYRKDQLAKLALDGLRDLFGDDFAEEVKSSGDNIDTEKLAEVVHTLPRGEAELFDRLMADNNLLPAMHKAASCRQGFTRQDFAQMAQAYRP